MVDVVFGATPSPLWRTPSLGDEHRSGEEHTPAHKYRGEEGVVVGEQCVDDFHVCAVRLIRQQR